MKKKLLSLFLALCMTLSLLPVNVMATGTDESDTDAAQELVPDDQSGILYSDAELTLTADSYLAEDGGDYTVTLTRGGDAADEASFTVVAYDNNANYGEDYRIVYNGEAVRKLDGAQSVYDAFRNNGTLTSALAFELAATAALAEAEDDEDAYEVSAADILAQLDELDAKAVEFVVTFPAGEREITLTIEVIDDDEPEYEETFLLAVLDENGEAVEGAQQAFAIVDNDSPTPSVSVDFACADELALTDEAEAVELRFRRTGNLATSTLVTLYVDGEPYGQVDFAPYQVIQTVDAVVAGVYTLDGSSKQVEVIDNTTAETTVVEGADPILDAIPDEYAVIRTPRQGDLDDVSWVPNWATGAEGSNEKQIIVLGTTSNNLFVEGYTEGVKGSITFYEEGYNIHNISTSGTGSGSATGKRNMDTKAAYDMTGVESVETTFEVSGLDHEGQYGVRLSKQSWQIKELKHDPDGDTSVHTMVVPVDKAYRTSSQKVYFSNIDPDDGTCRGTEMFVPNALKFNLRTYRFRIEYTPSKMGGANDHMKYTHSKSDGSIKVPTIDSDTYLQYLTINSYDYTGKTVNICYTSQDLYPAKLVGYKLMTSSGDLSELIPLGSDGQTADTVSFIFDKDFLKKYESKYCYLEQSSLDGDYWTFHVIPIYEKIKYTKLDIMTSTSGTLKLSEDSGYIGDQWVFEAEGDKKNDLIGVWYQAKDTGSSSIKKTGIAMTPYSQTEQHKFVLDVDYPIYKVQGVFSEDASKLVVELTTATSSGELEKSGVVVTEDSYIVGDYVPLIAHRNSNTKCVTRWHVKGSMDYVYGDVYYYQLDGYPEHNTVYAEFVSLQQHAWETGLTLSAVKISGTLERADKEVRPGGDTEWKNPADAVISITDDHGNVHTVVTDEKGRFTIEDFWCVVGENYSMSVTYDDTISYTTIKASSAEQLIQLPQFGTGVPYPETVSASVNGKSTNTNALVLSEDGSEITSSTKVYVPEKGYAITGVKYYFVQPKLADNGMIAATTVEYDATHIAAADYSDFEVWTINIPAAYGVLFNGQHLYVEVFYDKAIYQNNKDGTVEMYTTPMSTGLVDTGYTVTNPGRVETFSVSYEVPSTPNMQNTAFGGDLSKINIPVLGKLDLSLTSKTGGFFAQRKDAEGNTVLLCGSSWLANFGTGTVKDKLAQKQATKNALDAAAKNSDKAGAANADVTAISGEPTGTSVLYTAKVPSKWTFNPAYMFKFTFSPKTDGSNDSYVSRFEMALGVDANYVRNIPFSVYGVPFYVCLTFTTEAYFDIQAEFAESKDLQIEGVTQDLILTSGKNQDTTTVESFLAAPVFNLGVKGGVGYNGFLSLYLTASVSVPFIIEVYPNVIGAFSLAATVGFGADLVLFSAQISETIDVGTVGYNDEIIKDLGNLKPIGKTSVGTATASDFTLDAEELEQLLDEVTFAPMVRTVLRRAATGNADGTVASGVFKNTGVHLLKGDDNTVYAFYLRDSKLEDTLNYLTVAYAKSTNGGETWEEEGYVSDNTKKPYTSLQYDINLFELDDYTLITWSEANFDDVLENLGDVDINKLTPAQISKFMNAMNLKGCLFDKSTGMPVGETFTIAENSTVACGALDAVQNGEMIYVYYQRNVFPYDETAGEVTLEQLLSTERTIAMARANVNKTDKWESTTVRAMNANGKEYRITEVEPFVHDGVMGEILELDRDGKLAIWDEDGQTWVASNEDRQLYLRTYSFDEDGTPQPSALMAITNPNVCARSPQVVSNDDYLHLFWNQNGKVVYVTDFVATYEDNADVREGAYALLNADGTVSTANLKGKYYANDIASDEAHFHVGTTFSASMDDAGNVLLSWVATDTASPDLTDEVYGVMLETVTNAEAVELSGDTLTFSGSELKGSETVYQLYAKGAPVALTDDAEEKSLIGALDSVFLGNDSDGNGNSSFLLVFSKLDETTRQLATSADIKAQQSVYKSKLEITAIDAPKYPTPGEVMTVSVTVTNNGLGEAKNVYVHASNDYIDVTNGKTIASILPGCSETVELKVHVSKDFDSDTTMTVTAGDASAEVELLYGPYFVVKHMPEMANLTGTSDYTTATQVYNAGNAAGVPTLNYKVTIFASNEKGEDYTYTADEKIAAGESAVLNYTLEDTPVTADKTGTLTITVDTTGELDAYQYIQGQMPKLKTKIMLTKADLKPTEPDDDDDFVIPVRPSKPTETEPETKEPVSFTDVPSGSWYEDAVAWAVEQGITKGTGDGTTFSPDLDCDRAQAVTFLWRAAGSPAPQSSEMPFTDVPADAWYREAVLWAVEQGITKGVGDGTTFCPTQACDRAQIVTMIYRLEQANGGGFTGAWAMKLPFSDTPDWAYEAIAWCYMKGITKGTGDGSVFSPYLTCSRAQIVTMLHRYANI